MQFEAGYAGWIQKRLGQEDMALPTRPKQEDVASACLEHYKAAVTVWVHEYQDEHTSVFHGSNRLVDNLID